MRKQMLGFIAAAVSFLLVPASTFAAIILNVPGDSSTIQAAIDIAAPGDTVQVAAGTYAENIILKPGVIVQGAGASVTTIQGNGSTAVVTAPNVDSNSKIDGFTINGGGYGIYITLNSSLRISNNNITRNVGYGIWSIGSSPSIANNTITENGNDTSNLLFGAAICLRGGSPTVTNNLVSANISKSSQIAGLYISNSNATVDHNTISGHLGYPLFIDECSSCSPNITNNIITGNTNWGIFSKGANPIIHGNTLIRNSSGIYCEGGPYSDPTITNNTITESTSPPSGAGLVLHRLRNATIRNNVITANAGYGVRSYGYNYTIDNNTITGNEGGGLIIMDTSGSFNNNIISGNGLTSLFGGIMVYANLYRSLSFTNNTITGNTPAGVSCDEGSTTSCIDNVTITNSIIWGNDSADLVGCTASYSDVGNPVLGGTNISEDPKFVDPAADDYHLQPISPAIDAGSNAEVPFWLTTDIDGDPRIVNGMVDMGADEVSGTTPGETPAGTDVPVTPVDSDTGEPETTVEITFSEVTNPGITSVAKSESGPPTPSGFSLGDPPTYFEINTTAVLAPDSPITVCINYTDISFGDENMLRLFHQPEGGTLEDVTSSLDSVNDIICGVVSSLSPFAVVEASYEFVGFFYPVQTGPEVVNLVKAGRAIPVKWQLQDQSGGFIDDLSKVRIHYKRMPCSESSLLTDLEEVQTSGSSGLRYDYSSNQFVYNWETEKNMAGKCYRLNVELFGFDVQSADFQMW